MKDEAKEDIRARLAIEDVIGEYVELKRAGRSFKGLSPFTNERTPSFFVSPEKNIWHDFSSNKGGDIYQFIMEVEGMNFREALELLARKANIDLSLYENSKSKGIAKKKQKIYKIHELAVNYYQHKMIRDKKALSYVIKTRGISKKTIESFKIGFAPSGGGLISYLKRKNFSQSEIDESGITNRFGGDLFKDRMMIPLMDASGKTIGFTGRIIVKDDKAPKYLNTPQTILYNKSWHVFGLSQAKEKIRKHDYAVVVEGNMDVISSWQAGVEQTVATAGTAMTLQHLKTIGRITKNIKLAYDGDEAGLNATERVIPIAEEAGMDLSIISMPEGVKDPDELIKKDVKLWQNAIDASEPVVDWVLNKYSKRFNIKTAKGKQQYSDAAIMIIKTLSDPVVREHYIKIVSEKIGASPETIQRKMENISKEDKKLKEVKNKNPKIDKNKFENIDKLLALMSLNEKLRRKYNNIDELFVEQHRVDFYNYLKTNPDQNEILKNNSEYGKIVLLRAESHYLDCSEDQQLDIAEQLLERLKKEHIKNKKEHLTKELSEAENRGDEEEVLRLLTEIQKINKEIFSEQRTN